MLGALLGQRREYKPIDPFLYVNALIPPTEPTLSPEQKERVGNGLFLPRIPFWTVDNTGKIVQVPIERVYYQKIPFVNEPPYSVRRVILRYHSQIITPGEQPYWIPTDIAIPSVYTRYYTDKLGQRSSYITPYYNLTDICTPNGHSVVAQLGSGVQFEFGSQKPDIYIPWYKTQERRFIPVGFGQQPREYTDYQPYNPRQPLRDYREELVNLNSGRPDPSTLTYPFFASQLPGIVQPRTDFFDIAPQIDPRISDSL